MPDQNPAHRSDRPAANQGKRASRETSTQQPRTQGTTRITAAKPTRAEKAERIQQVANMLAKRLRKGEIKFFLKKKYGIKNRTIENYLARARQTLVDRTGASHESHQSDAFAFYESIIRNPELSITEKLRAQENICQLLGLNAPTKIAATNPEGDEAYHVAVLREMENLTDEQLLAMRDIKLSIDRQIESASGVAIGHTAADTPGDCKPINGKPSDGKSIDSSFVASDP